MDSTEYNAETVKRFADRFHGYDGAYGVYTINTTNDKGKKGGRGETVSEPLTLELIERHFAGRMHLGILPLDADCKVSWACIDIDVIGIDHKELVAKIRSLSLPLVVCRSKSGGAHCFLFLATPSSATTVRDYLVACAAALGHPGVEVFPKQTERQEGETGNWLNMPYQHVEFTHRYAVGDTGDHLSLEQFLDYADAAAVSVDQLVTPEVPMELVPLKKGEKFVLPDSIPESGGPYNGRNETLFKYGCSLQAKGWADDDIRLQLREVNYDRCDPPLKPDKLQKIITQVLKYEKGSPIPEWVEDMNERHAVVAEAGKALVLNTKDWDPAMNRRVLTYSTFADFKSLYLNQYIQAGFDKEGKPKFVSKGGAWLAHSQRRQYNGTTFAPGQTVDGWFNAWQGFSIEPRRGDWSRLRAHMFENLCGSNEAFFNYLLGWMAFTVQHPSRVPEVAVVLLGGRGVGKGIVVNAHGSLMREHYVSVSNPEHVSGKFNAHLKDTVILFLDEAFWAGDKKGEGTLKRLITDEFIPVEKKRIDVIMSKNYCHVWVASNESWAVPSGLDERRFFVLDVAKTHQQDHEYFGAIAKQLDEGGREALLYDLLDMDLSKFNPRSAPMTPALFRQKIHSMDKKVAWWFESLWNGEIARVRGEEGDDDAPSGWNEQVVKDHVYRAYLEHSGNASARSHRGTQTELGMFLRSMLPDGWPGEKRVVVTRWAKDSNGDNKQVLDTAPGFVFPSLKVCRAEFDLVSKQANEWPGDDGDAPEGEPVKPKESEQRSVLRDEDIPF